MKTINFFAILILMLSASISIAQTTVGFSYDGAGNRIKREIVLVKSIDTNKDSSSVALPLTENLDDLRITIYPNPTQGKLSVEISNMQLGGNGEITLYNLDGKEILYYNATESLSHFDFSTYPIGLYILHIKVGQKVSKWKIIKQ